MQCCAGRRRRDGGNTYAVVSVNAMENVDSAMLKRGSISLGGRDIDTRLQRRTSGCIPRVRIRGVRSL